MVVHDDLLVIIVLKQMKIARWGCESARACTHTRREPRVCHLHAYHARQRPVKHADRTRHDRSRDNSQVPGDNPSFCRIIYRSTRANAGFGENYGNAGEIGRKFPWFWGGTIGRHGSRAGSLRCMCGGGSVGTTGTSRRGRNLGHIGRERRGSTSI